ncbi:hypothetical protein Pme01_22950 [Planosporangium mesophilum]|uniref:Uncharacterized protein n=1 Tax=Planosporangium mesophilum TaxID=689768 RepID=A0A8J3X3B9_9ACTN|nr:hypothetical protein Pme01_22950 [Planosporangium mesophilum]
MTAARDTCPRHSRIVRSTVMSNIVTSGATACDDAIAYEDRADPGARAVRSGPAAQGSVAGPEHRGAVQRRPGHSGPGSMTQIERTASLKPSAWIPVWCTDRSGP